MTLAAEQDTQVDPSPIPLPGSPSGQPQNLNSNYPLEDKTETTPEDSVEIIEVCGKYALIIFEGRIHSQTYIRNVPHLLLPNGLLNLTLM